MGVEAQMEGWGSRIYEARTSGMRRKRGKQMTQGELAQAIGVTASQVGFYESETNWPGWAKWIAMAEILEVTVGWLVAGEDHKSDNGEGKHATPVDPQHGYKQVTRQSSSERKKGRA